jgi:Na+-transporting NADH:ubiquinone oxidoreductase subunit C
MKRKKPLDVLFILVLGVVSATVLLGIRSYSAPRIAHYEEVRLKVAIIDAAGVEIGAAGADVAFEENITAAEADGFEYYRGPGEVYVFEFAGRGLWGMIEGVVTLDPDTETIRGVRIMAQEETPGLGSRIGEAEYLDQFRGKKVAPELTLALRTKASSPTEVDAISGATISSRALLDVINGSVKEFQQRVDR